MYNQISFNRICRQTGRDMEFINLSPVPHDETCTPAGGDHTDGAIECTALINQLKRMYGEPPAGAEFVIIWNEGHEAGTYQEPAICYVPEDEGDEEAQPSPSYEYAMKLERGTPDKWDAEALQELRAAGHSQHQPAKVIQLKRA
jgi:hypothetical protein